MRYVFFCCFVFPIQRICIVNYSKSFTFSFSFNVLISTWRLNFRSNESCSVVCRHSLSCVQEPFSCPLPVFLFPLFHSCPPAPDLLSCSLLLLPLTFLLFLFLLFLLSASTFFPCFLLGPSFLFYLSFIDYHLWPEDSEDWI